MWRKKNRKTIGIFHIVGCYPNKILLMHTKACPFRKLSCNLFFASFHYERVGFFSSTEKLDFTIRSNMHTNCGKFMFRHHFHCRCKSEPWAFTMFGIQCIRKMDERIDSQRIFSIFLRYCWKLPNKMDIVVCISIAVEYSTYYRRVNTMKKKLVRNKVNRLYDWWIAIEIQTCNIVE